MANPAPEGRLRHSPHCHATSTPCPGTCADDDGGGFVIDEDGSPPSGSPHLPRTAASAATIEEVYTEVRRTGESAKASGPGVWGVEHDCVLGGVGGVLTLACFRFRVFGGNSAIWAVCMGKTVFSLGMDARTLQASNRIA